MGMINMEKVYALCCCSGFQHPLHQCFNALYARYLKIHCKLLRHFCRLTGAGHGRIANG